jgi:hypothetical protein
VICGRSVESLIIDAEYCRRIDLGGICYKTHGREFIRRAESLMIDTK